MLEVLKDFYQTISIVDLIYMLITILSLIKCYKKGFVLSILSMLKWLLAYVITLFIFPRAKPYFSNIIDNEYILDVVLGTSIFIIIDRTNAKFDQFTFKFLFFVVLLSTLEHEK